MKLPRFTRTLLVSIIGLFALASYAPTTAHDRHHYPYTFYDVGTLGGPQNYHNFPGPELNNRGMLALFSDIPALDPRHDTPSLCFNGDCYRSHAAFWQNGHLTDLGAFPGLTSSTANAISANGRYLVGVSTDGTLDPASGAPVFRAVRYAHHQVTDLGTLGGSFSNALDVNNAGLVVGAAQNAIPDPFAGNRVGLPSTTQTRAFLWQHGVMKDLGTLGGNDAEADFINARGQIAGSSFTSTVANPTTQQPTQHPFLWERGSMVDLGSLGGTSGYPIALNDQGQVVGSMNLAGDQAHHAFLWKQGRLIDLGTLGGNTSDALWENAVGHVVGRADLPGSAAHVAFLWRDGTMHNLGLLSGDECSTATGINDSDQVVGGSGICGVGGHAWLWDHGTLVNLSDLVAPVAGWSAQVHAAFYINDSGIIYGVGVLANGDEHAVMLVPNTAAK